MFGQKHEEKCPVVGEVVFMQSPLEEAFWQKKHELLGKMVVGEVCLSSSCWGMRVVDKCDSVY